MAGDFREPFSSSISFQADSLHSGSISFGRFEKEDLTWERRSSFSHNRYLEEVEKCSKPGSVIEKKAYFEAHFKKKGILLPGIFDGFNGRECQNGENDGYENSGQGEEDYNLDGSCNYSHSDDDVALENVDCSGFDNGNEGGEFDYVHDENHHGHFDESPVGSEYNGECAVIECQREDPIVLSSESRLDAAVDDVVVLVKGVDENVKSEEVRQTETMRDELHLNNDKQEMEMKYNLKNNAANVDESSMEIDLSPKSGTTRDPDNTSAGHRQNLSPKSRVSEESKSVKPRMKSPINGSQAQKIVNNVKKTAARNQNIRERETPQGTKSEKESSQTATPTRRVLLRAKNKENSESGNSRLHPVSKSDKEPRVKKYESPPSRSKRVESIAHLTTNRTKQNVSSIKPDTRPNATAFSFKSDERAERRKKQEKTEAEIKQFRKSLNFKATPMASFYHLTRLHYLISKQLKYSTSQQVQRVELLPPITFQGRK